MNPDISTNNKKGSMAFISELFHQQDAATAAAVEHDTQQLSSQPEMSMAEFRDFQTYLSEKKGTVVTNATLKIEMAKFISNKRRATQNESSQKQQLLQQQRNSGAMSKLMAVSGFRSTKKIVQQQPSIKPAPHYPIKSIPTAEQEVNLHGVPYPFDTPTMTKEKSKKPRGKFLTGLANEKVPKEDRFKNRKTRADFISNKFPNMEISI